MRVSQSVYVTPSGKGLSLAQTHNTVFTDLNVRPREGEKCQRRVTQAWPLDLVIITVACRM
jgi:hypothetical protein